MELHDGVTKEHRLGAKRVWLGSVVKIDVLMWQIDRTNSFAGVVLCDVPETLICLASVGLASILQWDG